MCKVPTFSLDRRKALIDNMAINYGQHIQTAEHDFCQLVGKGFVNVAFLCIENYAQERRDGTKSEMMQASSTDARSKKS